MLYKTKKPSQAEILKEIKEVQTFIKSWQKRNLYKAKEDLQRHNKQFRNDFKEFLNTKNFSEYTNTFFTN